MLRFVTLALFVIASPAAAEWIAASPSVTEAAKNPRVAAVLAARNVLDTAIVSGDKAAFLNFFAADTVVNSPYNNVTTRTMADKRFEAGGIAYKYLRNSIEYAAPRRDNEVVLMGEETYEPRQGMPNAGKTIRRRFTDLWRLEDGQWKLNVRQATIFSIK